MQKHTPNYYRAKILHRIFHNVRKLDPDHIEMILCDAERKRHARRMELNKEPIPRVLFDRALQLAATYSINISADDLRLASRRSKYD